MKNLVLLLAASAVIFGVNSSGFASALESYTQEYRAYNEALARGDRDAAATHAEAAWRGAEAEIGAQQKTAILAYNFARMVYAGDPQRAIEPLINAIEIGDTTETTFEFEEPLLMLRLAEAKVSYGTKSAKKKLRKALEQQQKEGSPKSLFTARAWFYLARSAMRDGKFANAKRFSDISGSHFANADNVATDEMIGVLMLRGKSRLKNSSRSLKDTRDAFKLFNRAVGMYLPKENVEQIDPGLASAIAWRSGAYAAEVADAFPEQAEKREKNEFNRGWLNSKPTICQEFKPIFRMSPPFPNQEKTRWNFAGIVMSFDVGLDNKPTNVKVLSAIPSDLVLEELYIATIKGWKYRGPTDIPSVCKKGHFETFSSSLFP